MKSKARIVRVGNSRGIRIPKAMLDEAGLADDVELDARAGSITIRSARQPRAGWAEAAAQLAAGGNSLLDPAAPTEFDDTEWVWE